MKNITDRDRNEWSNAFIEHGRALREADRLAIECEKWATNNPDMTWQECFDMVLLEDETEE